MARKKKNKQLHIKIKDFCISFWNRRLWNKILVVLTVIGFIIFGTMYGIAQWYINKHADEPLVIGASFIPSYARFYDLDEREVLRAMIDDLGIKRFRLVSYWNIIEPERGKYDYSELDWQYDMIEEAGGEVTLAIGLRQPRWPECHTPTWAEYLPPSEWRPALNQFIATTVDRYKDRPATVSYQLENEFLLEVFGECRDFDRQRLIDEFNLVKTIDPDKPLITTRSNNAVPSWPVGEPRADINGATIYKRVWDRTVTRRYFEYPIPPWYYAFLAGGAELTTGTNTFIHEMQTEAWAPIALKDASIEEQDKSLAADELYDRIKYGVDTGIKTMDLWGVEWWYWRKVNGDPSLWDEGKRAIDDFQGQTR